MNMREYQELAARTSGNFGIEYAGIGLLGEIGELCNLIKKDKWHKNTTITKEKVMDEVGDVLWYLAEYARCERITFEDVLFTARAVITAYSATGRVNQLATDLMRCCAEMLGINLVRESIYARILPRLVGIANHYGFTLEEAAIANIEKLKQRYPEGFTTAASIARVDVQKGE